MHGFERNEAGKIFVGGLSWDTTKESLLNYFSQYGEVVDCVVMKNPDTGKSRGFGFVTYRDPQCLETVLSVPAHIVDGRQVDPKACNPKGPNRGGMGGGGGGGGGGGMREGGGPDGGPRMNRGGRMEGAKDRKIFIGGLPSNADEELIRNFFSKYGKVGEVTVMYDAQKQRSRGFGFLTFENEDAVNQVCREHYINFNGKKVECKRATPRDNRGGGQHQDDQPPVPMPPQPMGIPNMEMPAGHPMSQPGPGPVPVQDPNWSPGAEGSWGQPPQQGGPPPPVGAPGQFPPGFPGGYQQGEPGQPGGWPQQPPPQAPGGWPPGSMPPGPQGTPGAPASAPFVTASAPSATYSTAAPTFQPPPGAPVYQWSSSPPGPQGPPANGQPPPLTPMGQSPPSSYAYAAPAYGSSPAGIPAPHSAAGVAPRQYQEFSNGQVQIATSVAPVQAPAAPAPSTTQAYSAYASPYVTPQSAGSAPPPDPYGQPAPVAPPPQGAVQVASPPAGQPTAVPAGYGSPVAQTPVAAGTTDPAAAAKTAVDYSSYYSAYGNVSQYSPDSASYPVGANVTSHITPAAPGGLPQGGASYTSVSAHVASAAVTGYGAEASPAAAAGAYGAQPAPAPAPSPYGGQGDTPQAVAYGGAPGPSPPSFQRQGSASQGYHPYARR